jgi:hypothetical protein
MPASPSAVGAWHTPAAAIPDKVRQPQLRNTDADVKRPFAAASSVCVYRLANTHMLAACASSRCSAWPARSQSPRPSPGVSSTAVAAGQQGQFVSGARGS